MLSIELGSSHVRACQPCSMLELGAAAAAVASSVAVGQPPLGCSGVCRPWQRQRSSRLTSSPGYSLNIRGTCSAARLDIAARAVAVACADRRPPLAFPAAGQGAFGNMCRGGHMYAPTKVWRRWHRKINVNQKRCAGWRCWGGWWLGGASTGLPGSRQSAPSCLPAHALPCLRPAAALALPCCLASLVLAHMLRASASHPGLPSAATRWCLPLPPAPCPRWSWPAATRSRRCPRCPWSCPTLLVSWAVC